MKITNFIVISLALLLGCGTSESFQDDDNYKYFVGKGEFKRTVQEAHQIATENIFKQVSEFVGIEVSVSYSSEVTELKRTFRDKLDTKTDKLFLQSHIINTKIDEQAGQGLVSVTLIAKYPKSELDSERKRIENYRHQKRLLLQESVDKIEMASKENDFSEIQTQLPVLFSNDYSENDLRKILLYLSNLLKNYSVDELESDSCKTLKLQPHQVYIIFGKTHSEKIVNKNGSLKFSPETEGKISPFDLNRLKEKIPESVYDQLDLFSYSIKRKKSKFSFEFEFNSENDINVQLFKDNFYSSLTKIGFENNPKEAKFRVSNYIESHSRSGNTGGVISIGMKVVTTIKSISDKRTATFSSNELIGFGGNEKDASKNATDKIQIYLISDWIESFNYTFYENFN